MRKLIAGMKVSVDLKVVGPDGYADWVGSWSEDYGLTGHIDCCLLGAGMYPGYEQYWTAVQNQPAAPLPMTGKLPTSREIEWGNFAARTPHLVLSNTLTTANWPKTRFLKSTSEIEALKHQPGKDIYLMGGARLTTSLIDAGLVDELRLIMFPLIAGGEHALFSGSARRQQLELLEQRKLSEGCVYLAYRLIR